MHLQLSFQYSFSSLVASLSLGFKGFSRQSVRCQSIFLETLTLPSRSAEITRSVVFTNKMLRKNSLCRSSHQWRRRGGVSHRALLLHEVSLPIDRVACLCLLDNRKSFGRGDVKFGLSLWVSKSPCPNFLRSIF